MTPPGPPFFFGITALSFGLTALITACPARDKDPGSGAEPPGPSAPKSTSSTTASTSADPAGTAELLSRPLGEDGHADPAALIVTRAGGYAIAGTHVDADTSADAGALVQVLDGDGGLRWSVVLGQPNLRESLYALAEVDAKPGQPGPLLVVGERGAGKSRRPWIAQLDGGDGSVQWERDLDELETMPGGVRALAASADGSWLLAGDSALDMAVWAIAPGGSTSWRHTYGGPGPDRVQAVARTESGWLLGGSCAGPSGAREDCLLAITPDGTMTWSRRYGAAEIRAIAPTPAGAVLVGERQGAVWVTFIDASGQRLRELNLDRGAARAVLAHDGAIVLAGHHRVDEGGHPRGWIATLSADGLLVHERDLGTTLPSIAALAALPRPDERGFALVAQTSSAPQSTRLCRLDGDLRGCED